MKDPIQSKLEKLASEYNSMLEDRPIIHYKAYKLINSLEKEQRHTYKQFYEVMIDKSH